MKKLITIFFLLSVLFSFGQEGNQLSVMSYSQFLEAIEKGETHFENIHLKLGEESTTDSSFWKIDTTYREPSDTIYSYTELPIQRVKFSNKILFFDSKLDVEFKDCEFLKGISIYYSDLSFWKFSFKNCIFSGEKNWNFVTIEECKKGGVIFEKCFFNDVVLQISRSNFQNRVNISDCVFEYNTPRNFTNSNSAYSQFFNINNKLKSLTVYRNTFVNKTTGRLNSINFSGSIIDDLSLIGNEMSIINFYNTKIVDNLIIDSLGADTINMHKFHYPINGTSFAWDNLNGEKLQILRGNKNLGAKNDSLLSNTFNYNLIVKLYNNFFHMYKEQGDLESANACYVELKNLETRRLKYLYDTEGGVDRMLNYRLNTFLKFFAEYGTSPIKSVKISGWVILIFGFFYFFFYSEWDKINRKFLMEKSGALIGYFRSEQKLEDLYSDTHKEDLNTFNEFKQNLKESKTEVPFFFMLFLKPLYWVAVIKHKFNKSLYKRVEFLQGRWVDLTSGKKFFLGTLTFLAILTYGLYLVAIRSLNSLILSINTFTTLGFGDIPVVGISRYVAILEGFLGWFLLSIFSVSLISQILQN